MPDPPHVDLLTRFLLENPYPLGTGLVLLGLVLGWRAHRDGQLGRARLALLPIGLGIAVLVVGWQVTTSGEHARRVTRSFVDAAIAGDLVAATDLLAPDVLLHYGKPENVGHEIEVIIDGLTYLSDRFVIESNRISMLDGYSETRNAATVHLACWTEASGSGPTPSQWVLRVERGDDGVWTITDLTWVSVNMQAPPATR